MKEAHSAAMALGVRYNWRSYFLSALSRKALSLGSLVIHTIVRSTFRFGRLIQTA